MLGFSPDFSQARNPRHTYVDLLEMPEENLLSLRAELSLTNKLIYTCVARISRLGEASTRTPNKVSLFIS